MLISSIVQILETFSTTCPEILGFALFMLLTTGSVLMLRGWISCRYLWCGMWTSYSHFTIRGSWIFTPTTAGVVFQTPGFRTPRWRLFLYWNPHGRLNTQSLWIHYIEGGFGRKLEKSSFRFYSFNLSLWFVVKWESSAFPADTFISKWRCPR